MNVYPPALGFPDFQASNFCCFVDTRPFATMSSFFSAVSIPRSALSDVEGSKLDPMRLFWRPQYRCQVLSFASRPHVEDSSNFQDLTPQSLAQANRE